jgi:UDP-GlcNAc:undecaprenyl-phosphate/decaprenyl-phosphate GlcNAc-1-phosphate transferase
VRITGRVGRAFPVATNYRGKRVGVWLGVALTSSVVGWILAFTLIGWVANGHLASWLHRLLWVALGLVIVCLAGLYDDFRPNRVRGIARQLAALPRGRVESGVVKLVVITGMSVLVAWMLGARGWRLGLGIPVLAGCANLWNLLDVVPGRSLKFFLPAMVAFLLASSGSLVVMLAATGLVVGALSLMMDLSEAAMLGDAGANVLGFMVGVGLVILLPPWGLAIALAMISAVHVLSETVTLSRPIAAWPPLRHFDELGRARS